MRLLMEHINPMLYQVDVNLHPERPFAPFGAGERSGYLYEGPEVGEYAEFLMCPWLLNRYDETMPKRVKTLPKFDDPRPLSLY